MPKLERIASLVRGVGLFAACVLLPTQIALSIGSMVTAMSTSATGYPVNSSSIKATTIRIESISAISPPRALKAQLDHSRPIATEP